MHVRFQRLPLLDESIGESRLVPISAVLASAGLYATLPSRFVAGPSAGVFSVARWFVPAVTVVLLAALVASVPEKGLARAFGLVGHRLHVERRVLALSVISLLSAANAAAIVLLVHLLVNGAQAEASLLLRAGIHMWCLNVLVFALWFWELDSGGPVVRFHAEPENRDFLFPQQADPNVAPSGWRPLFIDYLYLSFTNATAFSPTDTMPLTTRMKMVMMVEAGASAITLILVAARAVNILNA